jgi:hypothetical protein
MTRTAPMPLARRRYVEPIDSLGRMNAKCALFTAFHWVDERV